MCMSTLKAACDVTDKAFKVKLNKTHVAIYIIPGSRAQGHSGEGETLAGLLKCVRVFFILKKKGFGSSTLSF